MKRCAHTADLATVGSHNNIIFTGYTIYELNKI